MDGQDKNNVHPVVVGAASNPVVRRVWQIAEPLCLSEGLVLLFVEFQREPGGRTLRLYLDKPGGVTLEDCTFISRQLSDLLDVGLETDIPYRLEVSSPGPQRPLAKPEDFERCIGLKIRIRTIRPIDGQRNFTGTLAAIDDAGVHVVTRDRTVIVPFDDISKALVVAEGKDRPNDRHAMRSPERPKQKP